MGQFCQAVNEKFKAFGWSNIICNSERWISDLTTIGGNPLVYQIFNDHLSDSNTTLFLCGIHGDEAPTVYLCIHLVRDIVYDHKANYQQSKIVIAPIVNPDSFLSIHPTRTNGHGVDLNRNFPTQDWHLLAQKSWESKDGKDPRRYPGPAAGSEIETRFQIQLIEKFRPQRIIAIHSPYGFLDFDYGDGKKDRHLNEWQKVRALALQIGKACGKIRVTDFPFFPGSLGNYAGKERKIPTFTLELPDNRSDLALNYWQRFGPGLTMATGYPLRTATPTKKIASRELGQEAMKTAEN